MIGNNKQPRSRKRTEARKVEEQFLPAVKAVSHYINNTANIPDELEGYELPAGMTKDRRGREWQIQVRAVCSKRKIIRKDEIKPIIRSGSNLFRIRVLLKYIIDWSKK